MPNCFSLLSTNRANGALCCKQASTLTSISANLALSIKLLQPRALVCLPEGDRSTIKENFKVQKLRI